MTTNVTLGDHITYKQLTKAVSQGFSPIVEVESQDGIYTVRFHHAGGVSTLSDKDGKTCTYLGTGKIRELLGKAGLTHGVVTWDDQCADEMIGVQGHAKTPEERLSYGTRIAFQ